MPNLPSVRAALLLFSIAFALVLASCTRRSPNSTTSKRTPGVTIQTIESAPDAPSAEEAISVAPTVVRTSSGTITIRTSSSRIDLPAVGNDERRVRELIEKLRREHAVRIESIESENEGGTEAVWDTPLEWSPVFKGIDHAEIRASRPRQMVGQVLRVDLRAEGISFFTTPSNGTLPSDTNGLKTSSFLRDFELQAAINAAPFRPIRGSEGRPTDIEGLAISTGELVSLPSSAPSIRITKDNRVTIGPTPRTGLDDVYNAVAGYDMVLEDGVPKGNRYEANPRVSAGVSRDGRYFYMLVVDGRQWGYSMGATRLDLGQWLLKLGAWDGINLDGGGTSTMVVADSRGRPKLLNRPIHAGRPGNQRVSGSHLGVRALPLD